MLTAEGPPPGWTVGGHPDDAELAALAAVLAALTAAAGRSASSGRPIPVCPRRTRNAGHHTWAGSWRAAV